MKDKDQFVDQLMQLIEKYIDEQAEVRFKKEMISLAVNPPERNDSGVNTSTALQELPEILSAQHIADYLSISRKKVYELFQRNNSNGGIPNFSIGATRRVDKIDLLKWIEKLKTETTL
ncbi:helix-turn-helix domain-containing protein [Paenibacillus tundrae]|uniref:Excisionase family DNA binding protein n=1 Tax=Paenibacillus tundrae TaxID=528187 RepID=A0ABT9W7H1_9BACL|nr:helix-turn-helix domain-containing protein [Paenibacillus tundrae]MDQ0169198.1 excisionase family DNA binding protein [Paenibacillus tundrae]